MQRNDILRVVQEELDHLQKKASLPGFRTLDNWQHQLAKRLGRPAKEIFDGGLLATDFPSDGVHIHFEDGTDLTFRHAFFLGEPKKDGAIHRVVVFTEHCRYHEFWIGQDDCIEERSTTASELLARYDPDSDYAAIDKTWDNLAPVGREFGSPDFNRLMAEDAAKFSENLARLIQEAGNCRDGRSFVASLAADDDVWAAARNVQEALRQMGPEVTLEVGAAVWRHYSQSLAASWLSGADSVSAIAQTLARYIASLSQE